METILVEIKKEKGLALLKDLEALDILRVIETTKKRKKTAKLSTIFANKISKEEGDSINKLIEDSRKEWERNI